jgi:NodT family efflux transporter outer membrane factor (OMF) lipoprotein
MSISEPNNPRLTSVLLQLTACAVVTCLTACAVGPDFLPPPAGPTRHYSSGTDPVATVSAEGVVQHLSLAAELPADWWRLFGNAQIDALVRDGLTASPTIAAAEANLRAAQNSLRAGQGIFFPQVSASAGASREHPSPGATTAPLSEGVFNLFTLSASVSYALDLWGGERRTVEGLGAASDYQRNVARAAALTLSANIVTSAIALIAYDAEIAATLDIIGLERDQVRLAALQVAAGRLALAGVLALQSQLSATEAGLPALLQRRAQIGHLLAVLCGHAPSDAIAPHLGFDDLTLPQTLPLSLPAELIRQRPDILQAEAALHAASAAIGVATAALLPSVSLDGSFGVANGATAGLITAKNQVWSFGAGLATPIFHGGSLWYQREAAKDAYDASLATYRQTVLAAFEQVADTLRALEHDAEALSFAETGLTTAERALALVRVNVRAGTASYSDLLIADALVHQARLSQIALRAARYQDSVSLFAALGGGWWNDSSPASVTLK